jgi:hypothetical protein
MAAKERMERSAVAAGAAAMAAQEAMAAKVVLAAKGPAVADLLPPAV